MATNTKRDKKNSRKVKLSSYILEALMWSFCWCTSNAFRGPRKERGYRDDVMAFLVSDEHFGCGVH
jgi:hypothetical protein